MWIIWTPPSPRLQYLIPYAYKENFDLEQTNLRSSCYLAAKYYARCLPWCFRLIGICLRAMVCVYALRLSTHHLNSCGTFTATKFTPRDLWLRLTYSICAYSSFPLIMSVKFRKFLSPPLNFPRISQLCLHKIPFLIQQLFRFIPSIIRSI